MSAEYEMIRTALFMGAQQERDSAKLVLFGCPFDSTSSFRPGSRFGPAAIRAVSDVLETYCPLLDRDLLDARFADIGDLPLPPGDTQATLEMTKDLAKRILLAGQVFGALGGEHLLTLPLVQAALETQPELCVVQFDAHMDMRDEYMGVRLSHATVMRRISELLAPSRLLQVAVRSGTREEFVLAKQENRLRSSFVSPESLRDWVGDRPLYVTVDLDVLDPAFFPGTGTPEPGGIQFATLQSWLTAFRGCRWAGWDVMELSPPYDTAQVSAIVAAKIVRTLILTSTA